MFFEDVPDAAVGDLVAEVGQRALDPVVAPGRVLPGHAEDEAGTFENIPHEEPEIGGEHGSSGLLRSEQEAVRPVLI